MATWDLKIAVTSNAKEATSSLRETETQIARTEAAEKKAGEAARHATDSVRKSLNGVKNSLSVVKSAFISASVAAGAVTAAVWGVVKAAERGADVIAALGSATSFGTSIEQLKELQRNIQGTVSLTEIAKSTRGLSIVHFDNFKDLGRTAAYINNVLGESKDKMLEIIASGRLNDTILRAAGTDARALADHLTKVQASMKRPLTELETRMESVKFLIESTKKHTKGFAIDLSDAGDQAARLKVQLADNFNRLFERLSPFLNAALGVVNKILERALEAVQLLSMGPTKFTAFKVFQRAAKDLRFELGLSVDAVDVLDTKTAKLTRTSANLLKVLADVGSGKGVSKGEIEGSAIQLTHLFQRLKATAKEAGLTTSEALKRAVLSPRKRAAIAAAFEILTPQKTKSQQSRVAAFIEASKAYVGALKRVSVDARKSISQTTVEANREILAFQAQARNMLRHTDELRLQMLAAMRAPGISGLVGGLAQGVRTLKVFNALYGNVMTSQKKSADLARSLIVSSLKKGAGAFKAALLTAQSQVSAVTASLIADPAEKARVALENQKKNMSRFVQLTRGGIASVLAYIDSALTKKYPKFAAMARENMERLLGQLDPIFSRFNKLIRLSYENIAATSMRDRALSLLSIEQSRVNAAGQLLAAQKSLASLRGVSVSPALDVKQQLESIRLQKKQLLVNLQYLESIRAVTQADRERNAASVAALREQLRGVESLISAKEKEIELVASSRTVWGAFRLSAISAVNNISQQLGQKLGGALQSTVSSLTNAFADFFSGLISGSQDAAENFAKSLLNVVAGLALQMAAFFATTGIGMLLMENPQGAALLAVSAALVVLAAGLKSLAGSMGSSSGSSGGGSTPSTPRASAPNPNKKNEERKETVVVFVSEEPWVAQSPKERYRRFTAWQKRNARLFG